MVNPRVESLDIPSFLISWGSIIFPYKLMKTIRIYFIPFLIYIYKSSNRPKTFLVGTEEYVSISCSNYKTSIPFEALMSPCENLKTFEIIYAATGEIRACVYCFNSFFGIGLILALLLISWRGRRGFHLGLVMGHFQIAFSHSTLFNM